MNGVIYCRVSSKEQLEGTSLDSQELACRDYARAHQIAILKIFLEQGESAKFADRTQLLELIDFCRQHKGDVQVLLVWKLDRFARNVEDHYSIKATLAKYGVRIVSVTEPIEADPNGKLMETILAGFAQFDNDIRAMRTVQGMRRKIQEGIFPWKPPFGYLSATTRGEKKTESDRPDQPLFGLLQKAWREFATGAYTKAEIRRLLTSWGVVTRKGQPISAQSLDNLFRNRYYAGFVVDPWSGEEHEGRHVPMVTSEEFARVQQVIGRRRRALSHHRARPEFPLRGHVRCAACRRYLTGGFSRGRSRRYAYYSCYARPCASRRKSVSVQAVHDEFEDFLDQATLKPEARPALRQMIVQVAAERRASAHSTTARVAERLATVKRETQKLIQLQTRDLITDDEFLAQKARLTAQRTALESTSDSRAPDPTQLQTRLDDILDPLSHLRETWRACPDGLRRRFVQLLLPVGFSAGTVRTAERSRLFSIASRSDDGENHVVPFVRKHLNQIWQEIQAFAALIRDWRVDSDGSSAAVPTNSRRPTSAEDFEPERSTA